MNRTTAPEVEITTRPRLGATLLAPDRCEFRVWSPDRAEVAVHIVSPRDRRVPMHKNAFGYHEVVIDTPAGTRYLYDLDGIERPDPASRFQPEGVHRASEVVSDAFAWHDAQWQGVALHDYVIYELHVGTFTEEGTFEAVIPRLDGLKELGITAIELMPIGQFPGDRNWGYDGVYIGAPQNSYGGPIGLKRMVDAAHQRGLAVIVDAVYNHLGPEGNYLREYGPYFTDRYKTPWGLALNFDGPHSDHVRWFFIHNALMWIDDFHLDALRVDAVHAILDHSAEPFLQDLTTAVRERGAAIGRRVYTIAESDLNDPRVITPKENLGLGFDSQWSDDFHHALHVLLTREKNGYYVGYGGVSDLARVISQGYLYTGQHSEFRRRKYGHKPNTAQGEKFVVCAQNHDQIGNRMLGERLSTLVTKEKLRLAAVAVMLSPFLPMLFMGEEYGETAPFQYFTSHSDPDLIDAVRRGRLEEFHEFAWAGDAPDPHDEATFRRSKLRREEDPALRRLYTDLIRLRRDRPSLRALDLAVTETHADDERGVLLVHRQSDVDRVLVAFNFSNETQTVMLPFDPGSWQPLIESNARLERDRLTLPASSFGVFGA